MIRSGGCTDVGRTRPMNEDGYYISEYSQEVDGLYAIVADGMGGHQAGEVASGMAIQKISESVNQGFTTDMSMAELKDLLVTVLKQANSAVYQKSASEPACQGMGTTITLCFILGDQGLVAHVGDSRAYLLRKETLHQITTDHSLVQELMLKGQITAEEAANHPQKNVITRALGTDSGVEIDLYEFTVQPEDMLLLCTDGLSNMLQDDELAAVLTEFQGGSMERLSEQLVQKANAKGGVDNITAVLLTKESGLC